MAVTDLPLSWYRERIERGEPFSSLLYGDGEFRVLLTECTGRRFTQYQELVTPGLEMELWNSLLNPDANIVRGTDAHLLEWWTYKGQDIQVIKDIGERINCALEKRKVHVDWVNGVIWDTAVRSGQLGSFLRCLKGKKVTLVGNPALLHVPFLSLVQSFVPVPESNAAAHLDELENLVSHCGEGIYLLCMGLGAIPLIMRLRRRCMAATYLDLGSTFDVFVGLGKHRGWRQELYADPTKLQTVIAANMKGIIE